MEIVQQNPKEYFKTLKLLHIALIVGQILFALVVVFMFSRGRILDNPQILINIIDYSLIGSIICFLPASYLYYKWKSDKLKTATELKFKMNGYRNILIVRYALLEIPSLVSIVAVMLTGNNYYLLCSGMIVLLMTILRPSKENAIMQLGLNYDEINLLEDPTAIISEFQKSAD
jgi:hypothetical protein